jgi:ribonuclease P protein component
VNRSQGRLARSEDFLRAYRGGRSVANKYLVLYYFERPGAGAVQAVEGPRVGYSVSKRLGAAVDRNRVKRSLREAFRANRQSVGGDLDLVFVARMPAVELLEKDGQRAVEGKMVEVLQKASLLKSEDERRPRS